MIPEENNPAATGPDPSPARRHRPRPRRGPRRFPRPTGPGAEAKQVQGPPPASPPAGAQPRGGERRENLAMPGPEENRGQPAASRESIRSAVTQVEQITVELRRVLADLDEVLEILEQAEVHQTMTEREIESLRNSLRKLHRGRESSPAQPPSGEKDAA